jgi:microcystin-dependent protein
MPVETNTNGFIDGLVDTNPVSTDSLQAADDHLRLIKSAIKATFPSVTGAINATHTEINTAADGSTSATSTTLVDADRLVVNDDGTMVQVALTDLKTYLTSNLSVTSSMITDGTIATADIADNAITAAKLASGAAFVSGMVMTHAGSTAPSGWVLCYGQAISRTTYADLFTAIGTTYGAGDGSTTFNVPDLRGRVVAGQDDMGGASANRLTSPINGDTLGASGGSESHTLTLDEIPAHTHNTFYQTHDTSPGSGGSDSDLVRSGSSTRATSSAGGGNAHNNVQPTFILNYIIKT